jgi:hypothetical protein
MFNKITSGVVTDLLFNLLLTFVCLFFLAFVLVNDPQEEEAGSENDAQFMITMTWEKDVDIDLWVKLPNGKKVFYANREADTVFLDVDVIRTKTFMTSGGELKFVLPNQEIATIRGGSLEGVHVINGHYYGGPNEPVDVTIVVHDVAGRDIVWTGTKTFTFGGQELHFVKIDIEEFRENFYRGRYIEGQPEFMVGGN